MTEKLRIVPMRGWIAYPEGFGSSSACAIGNSDGDVVAMAVTRGQGFDVPAAKPMAQRIVACYNACTGIPTEQLESDFAQGYEPWGHVQHLRAQRDELLSALSEMVGRFTPNAWGSAENRRDALHNACNVMKKVIGTE